MKTNLEGDTHHDYKVGGDARHENKLRRRHAMKTNFEGDTRREN